MPTHVKTTDMVGIKESVADYISLIKPTDTPFLSSLASEKIKSTTHTWLEDTLRSVADNAKLEGHTYVETERDQPVTRSNHAQILSETFRVSGTADVVDTYGRKSETARETMKTGKLLKLDLEHALVGTGQTMVQRTGAVAGRMAGMQVQIAATTTTDAGTDTDDPLTETVVVETQEKLETTGGEASTLMVKPADMKLVAAWGASNGRTRELGSSEKKITNVVNVYESPYGTLRVVKNRRLRTTDALLYTPSSWKLLVVRDWFREKLAKTSDSEAWAMTGEFSLKHVNREASGLIVQLQ